MMCPRLEALVFGAERSVAAAWCPSYGFQRASSHAEKGLVMMVRSEASQRHGARPTVFSVQSYCFSASCTIPICNDFLVLLTTLNKFLSTTTQTTGTTRLILNSMLSVDNNKNNFYQPKGWLPLDTTFTFVALNRRSPAEREGKAQKRIAQGKA